MDYTKVVYLNVASIVVMTTSRVEAACSLVVRDEVRLVVILTMGVRGSSIVAFCAGMSVRPAMEAVQRLSRPSLVHITVGLVGGWGCRTIDWVS